MNVLLVWPRMPRSFWGMEASMDIVGRKASQPPLGLVTIAALCPRSWTLRLIDRRAGMDLADEDLRWADVVMVSGMGVQRDDMREVLRRARAAGRRTVVGGPYASAEPSSSTC